MKNNKKELYVDKNELAFYLNLYRIYSALKDIETKTTEEISVKIKKSIERKNKSFKIKKEKYKNNPDILNILEENKKIFIKHKKILSKEEYIKEFEELKIKYSKLGVENILNIDLNLNTNLDRFFELILLMIKRINKMGNFSKYNYREDFRANAVEKILIYCKNFDDEIISIVTKKKVSSFAYVTEIIYNAFLEIIKNNKREKEIKRKYYNDNTNFNDSNDSIDSFKDRDIKENINNALIINIKENDISSDIIKKTLKDVEESNLNIENNNFLDLGFEYKEPLYKTKIENITFEIDSKNKFWINPNFEKSKFSINYKKRG